MRSSLFAPARPGGAVEDDFTVNFGIGFDLRHDDGTFQESLERGYLGAIVIGQVF
jgi:hypothetical protein